MNKRQRESGLGAVRFPQTDRPIDHYVWGARQRGWRERLAMYLFPQRWPAPSIDELGFARNELHVDTFLVLGWKDRLRLLVSGKAALRIRIKTDREVRRSKARSEFSVLPAWTWER